MTRERGVLTYPGHTATQFGDVCGLDELGRPYVVESVEHTDEGTTRVGLVRWDVLRAEAAAQEAVE